MLGEWSKSPMFKAAVIAVFILIAISFFIRPRSGGDVKLVEKRNAFIPVQEAVGYVAAEEGARLLEPTGGGVVIVVPGEKIDELNVLDGAPYEKGFKVGSEKLTAVKYLGFYSYREFITLTVIQDIQKKFPTVELVVLFTGTPTIKGQEAEWVRANPPKIIAFQQSLAGLESIQQMLQMGILHTAFLPKEYFTLPVEPPTGTPSEIFEQHYRIMRR